MDTRAPTFTDDTAAQRLGQYNAWDIPGDTPIDLAWISKAHSRNPLAHRVLPHGEPSIAVRRKRGSKGDISSISLTICGPFQRASFYRPEPGEELIAVRLKPEFAAKSFGVSPADFFDQPPAVAPPELYDKCAASLRVAENSSCREIVLTLINDLLHAATEKSPEPPCEAYAASLLRQRRGHVKTNMLAATCGVSERHLRRRFMDSFGMTPKAYGRRLRLTNAALDAEKSATPSWARIAVATGFHDQSHMINEFKGLIGMTPDALHRERRALLAPE